MDDKFLEGDLLPNFNRPQRLWALIAFIFALLLQFNNCSPIQSQLAETGSQLSSVATNSYILQCIDSSDGSAMSAQLQSSVQKLANGQSGKINSLDWQQDEDLIVTLDHNCLVANNYNDRILNYITTDLDKTVSSAAYVIKKESVTHLQKFIDDALSSECLLSANKNYEVKVSASNDPFISNQIHLDSSLNYIYSISALPNTIDNIMSYVEAGTAPASQRKIKVAIIDTGVDTTNPDLVNMLARNPDGSIKGYNLTSDPSKGFLQDSGFHGTHVAGLIAAQYNNSFGVSGVYGRQVELYVFRVSNNGDTMTIASIANAIKKAVEVEKVDLINLSLSTQQDFTELRQAIEAAMAAGVTVVAAAGNGDENGAGQVLETGIKSYPAMYSLSSNAMITVGSLDLKTKTISKFSNRSSKYVDILAPGSNGDVYTPQDNREGIFSTIPMRYNSGKGIGAIISANGEFEPISGTSMSAPLVTGSLAAVLSMARSRGVMLTNTQLKAWLKGNGSPKNTNFNSFSAGGSYLNLQTLYNHASSQINALSKSPPTPPTTTGGLKITVQPTNMQAVSGESVTLGVLATSNRPITYQWYKNDTLITGATSAQYTISNLKNEDGASYYVLLQDGEQTIFSRAVDLKIAAAYCQ